jgi:hypothetical protein
MMVSRFWFKRLHRRIYISGFMAIVFLYSIQIYSYYRSNMERCKTRLLLINRELEPKLRSGQLSATVPNPGLPPERRLSWLVECWGDYIVGGQTDLLIHREEPWDSPTNVVPKFRTLPNFGPVKEKAIGTISNLICPANPIPPDPGQSPGLTQYVGIAGLGSDAASLPKNHKRAGVFGYDRMTGYGDIRDGLTNTMMVTETCFRNGPWTAGGPPTVRALDPNRLPYIGNGRQFGGSHSGKVCALFADGSVRFLRGTVSPRVFEAFSTIAGSD